MCNEVSLILTEDKIFHSYGIKSHYMISQLFRIPDTKLVPDFVKIEVSPNRVRMVSDDFSDLLDFTKWQIRFDQDYFPDWFDETKARERVIEWLKKQPVLTGNHDTISGNYLIAHDAIISTICGGAYIVFANNVDVRRMENSHLEYAYNCNIAEMCGSIFRTLNTKIDYFEEGFIRECLDTIIRNMGNLAQIKVLGGNSTVECMGDYSRIIVVREESIVKQMYDASQIVRLYRKDRTIPVGGDDKRIIQILDKSL